MWKALKDFFYYNFLCLLGKPRYPKSILPKQKFVPLLDIDAMATKGLLYIVRRADVNCDEALLETGILKDDIIKQRDVPGFSMNLLGSFYLLKHIKFKAKSRGAFTWAQNTKIYMTDFIDDYEVVSVYCPLTYDLNTIHNAIVPFTSQATDKGMKKDVENYYKAWNLTPEITGTEYKFYGRMIIKHEPTNLNYWHVELKLFHPQNQEVTRTENNQRVKSAETFVLENYLSLPLMELPNDIHKIDKSDYLIK